MEKTIVEGTVRECCKDELNLELQPSGDPSRSIRVCKVCGRKHYRMVLEPAKFGGVEDGKS